MAEGTLCFGEYEHFGDLEHYAQDVRSAGGQILAQDVNEDAEIGYLRIVVDDAADFWARFSKTQSYEFLD